MSEDAIPAVLVGNNEMAINKATMIRIVQFWVDRQLMRSDGHSLTVTDVSMPQTGRYADMQFVVSLSNESP